LLGLDLEAVTARLGRLLKPAANRKHLPAEPLLDTGRPLLDLSLEPSLASSRGLYIGNTLFGG
jgi:hypothetical protein